MIQYQQIHAKNACDMSNIHAKCFDRGWSEQEFLSLLSQNGTFGFLAFDSQKSSAVGFILLRLIKGECEILTFCTAPNLQQMGIGTALLKMTIKHLSNTICHKIFLEVCHTNKRAISLYCKFNFQQVGIRKKYYKNKDGQAFDALVLEYDFNKNCIF